MLNVSNIYKNVYKYTFIVIQARTKTKTHWVIHKINLSSLVSARSFNKLFCLLSVGK